MRQLSKLSRAGADAYRLRSNPPSNVCVFCLQHSRLPFSTSAPRPVDKNRKYIQEQARRQEKFAEANEARLTPQQLIARKRHRFQVEWDRIRKEAKRTGTRAPHKESVKAQFDREWDKRVGAPRVEVTEEDAERLDQAQAQVDNVTGVDYVKATNWDGLVMVGGEVEWDTGERFQSYLPAKKLSSNEQITVAVYRSLIEVFTAMSNGWSLQQLEHVDASRIYNHICQVRIAVDNVSPSEGGSQAIKLEYPNEQVENRIRHAIKPDAVDAPVETDYSPPLFHNPKKLAAAIEALGDDWRSISIADPAIKLAIIKRLTALLGKPISDFVIHKHNTVGSLIDKLVQPTPPAKLHETLVDATPLPDLPNISMSRRRVALVARETAVGRWKVIRKELRDKGLPVLKGISGWEHEKREERDKAKKERQERGRSADRSAHKVELIAVPA